MTCLDESRPNSCYRAGLDCQTCANNTAGSVARVCGTLAGATLETTFFALYPDPACAANLPAFRLAYNEIVGEPLCIAVCAAA
jgi:hypothetical protein